MALQGGAVKLQARHAFDCTPARFWEMYWDDDFDAMLMTGATFTRELLEDTESNGVRTRRVRITPHQELPSAAAAILGTSKLVYDQENRFDLAKSEVAWRVIPTILPGKLDANGRFQVVATPRGCEQVVDGDITVNVRFVGGRIESAVIGEVEKSYSRTAEVSRAWLTKHGA
jgi:hypothetical protein